MKRLYQLLVIVYIISITLILNADYAIAQPLNKGTLKGKLVDSLSSSPLAQANIQVYAANNNTKLITGVTSAPSGESTA